MNENESEENGTNMAVQLMNKQLEVDFLRALVVRLHDLQIEKRDYQAAADVRRLASTSPDERCHIATALKDRADEFWSGLERREGE